ncbi:hypothetical protein F-VV10_0057 [Faustovirus]|nr:hypothetical protein F-VV10_0057 [Faustovirus]
MIYGKAKSTQKQLRMRLLKKISKPRPTLPPEIILEILKHQPGKFLSVAKWTRIEALKMVSPVHVNTWNTIYIPSSQWFSFIEGMSMFRYSD